LQIFWQWRLCIKKFLIPVLNVKKLCIEVLTGSKLALSSSSFFEILYGIYREKEE
jgi:hypothetical protein